MEPKKKYPEGLVKHFLLATLATREFHSYSAIMIISPTLYTAHYTHIEGMFDLFRIIWNTDG